MNKVRRRYSCEICSKSFGKAEHLNRHRTTHTDAKPYSCPICGQKFTRPDSLARHDKGQKCRPANVSTRLTSQPSQEELSYHSSIITVTPHSDPQDPQTAASLAPLWNENPSKSDASAHVIDNIHHQQLNWPDSEALLESILSVDFGSWPTSSEALALPFHASGNETQTSAADNLSPWTSETALDVGQGGSYAVRDLTRTISNLSADMTAQADTTGLTPVFLDGCLHMFFEKFIPMFPVVHKATFVFSDCIHTLLLNAIALGSLFMGSEAETVKGEFLWRLAHTAVATLWRSLIHHKGPHDSCRGVQLVLTALLGQVYALLSKNENVRKTAQVFHSLGFYWARECGMYDIVDETNAEILRDRYSVDANEAWRYWAASETRLRALLGHYILDGQISQYSGFPPCQRHAANTLRIPAAPAIYNAATMDEWAIKMRTVQVEVGDFESLLTRLFRVENESSMAPPLQNDMAISSLSAKVLLEAMKCFICESEGSKNGVALGTIPKIEVSKAMSHLYRLISQSDQMTQSQRVEVMIRWHLIGLDLVVDSRKLCQNLCLQDGIQQHLFEWRRVSIPQAYDDLKAWCEKPAAKCALLHANAIRDLVNDLPVAYMGSIHIPACLFAAAVVYYTFIRASYLKIPVPKTVDWESLLTQDSSASQQMRSNRLQHVQQTVWRYLNVSSDQRDGPRVGSLIEPSQNLLYNFYDLAKHLRGAATGPWGISAELLVIVEKWVASCQSRF